MSDRPLPLPDPETAFFWEATARRQLEILRCQTCKTWVHYPKPSCWNCSSGDLKPEQVSGRGTVYSYTVTHQDVPGYTAPFAVVIVELEEQAGLVAEDLGLGLERGGDQPEERQPVEEQQQGRPGAGDPAPAQGPGHPRSSRPTWRM